MSGQIAPAARTDLKTNPAMKSNALPVKAKMVLLSVFLGLCWTVTYVLISGDFPLSRVNGPKKDEARKKPIPSSLIDYRENDPERLAQWEADWNAQYNRQAKAVEDSRLQLRAVFEKYSEFHLPLHHTVRLTEAEIEEVRHLLSLLGLQTCGLGTSPDRSFAPRTPLAAVERLKKMLGNELEEGDWKALERLSAGNAVLPSDQCRSVTQNLESLLEWERYQLMWAEEGHEAYAIAKREWEEQSELLKAMKEAETARRAERTSGTH